MNLPVQIRTKLFKNVVFEPSGCWEWTKGTTHGYGYIRIDRKDQKCHRLMWMIFKGEIPHGLFVLHRCDNRRCINPDHLFLGTNVDNIKDAAIKNRMAHKLELSDISEIRRLYIEGFTQVEISKRLGVTQGHVSKIITKKRRHHV